MPTSKTEYNIRIIDNGDKTYSIGFVHRLKTNKPSGKTGVEFPAHGEWVDGSMSKIVRLLTKGTLR